MRIKLTTDIPIEPKHGAMIGRVFECLRTEGPMRRSQAKFWFRGDAGEECAAFGHECVELPDEATG